MNFDKYDDLKAHIKKENHGKPYSQYWEKTNSCESLILNLKFQIHSISIKLFNSESDNVNVPFP